MISWGAATAGRAAGPRVFAAVTSRSLASTDRSPLRPPPMLPCKSWPCLRMHSARPGALAASSPGVHAAPSLARALEATSCAAASATTHQLQTQHVRGATDRTAVASITLGPGRHTQRAEGRRSWGQDARRSATSADQTRVHTRAAAIAVCGIAQERSNTSMLRQRAW